jgi:hypothetical protein
MATQAKIGAIFTANTAGLVAGTKTASSAMDKLAADVRGLRAGLGTLNNLVGVQVFTQLAGAAFRGANALYGMAAAASETIDSFSKLAARTGTTYGEFAGLALAGDLAGVSSEKLAGAMTKADRAFVALGSGSASAQKAFGSIGLSLQDLEGLSPADRFKKIADSISALPTAAERSAAAIGIFGKAGADLVPLFAGGAGSIGEATAQAESFGLALTNVQGTNVEAMNDSWTLVQKAVEGVVTQITANLAPAVTAINTAFTDFVSGFGGQSIGEAIADALLDAAGFLAGVADFIIANIPEVFRFAEGVSAVWNGTVEAFRRVMLFAQGVFNVFEVIGNVIGGLFSDIVSGLFSAAAAIADNIPGYGDTARGFREAAADWENAGDKYAAEMNKNEREAAESFSAAFASAGEVGTAIAGPVTTAFQAIRANINDARGAAEKTATAAAGGDAGGNVDAARQLVKGLDSRSSAGVAEMLRLMQPGADANSMEKRALNAAERTADAVESLLDDEGFEVAEIF